MYLYIKLNERKPFSHVSQRQEYEYNNVEKLLHVGRKFFDIYLFFVSSSEDCVKDYA